MRKAVGPVLIVCTLLASGCSAVEQSVARGNVNAKDVTACHAYGRWDQAARKGPPSGQLTAAMQTGLSHAVDGTLTKDWQLMQSDLSAGNNEKGFLTQIQAIGQRCFYLGLIDKNGNPT